MVVVQPPYLESGIVWPRVDASKFAKRLNSSRPYGSCGNVTSHCNCITSGVENKCESGIVILHFECKQCTVFFGWNRQVGVQDCVRFRVRRKLSGREWYSRMQEGLHYTDVKWVFKRLILNFLGTSILQGLWTADYDAMFKIHTCPIEIIITPRVSEVLSVPMATAASSHCATTGSRMCRTSVYVCKTNLDFVEILSSNKYYFQEETWKILGRGT